MNSLFRIILFVSITAIGCATYVTASKKADVVVVNPSGKPIAGAKVTPISHSIHYPSVLTNKNGEARIKTAIQKVVWIKVSKEGFHDSQLLDFNEKKPIKVELQPKK